MIRYGARQGWRREQEAELRTSTLPIHGGLVEIARQIAVTQIRQRRLGTYEPVVDGYSMCPACHVLRNGSSRLAAAEDDDPNESSRYECTICEEEYRVGR